MGLMKQDGSYAPIDQKLNEAGIGVPNLPANIEQTSPLYESPVTSTSQIDQYVLVSNPDIDKVSIDTTTYPNITKRLVGYSAGHRYTVTYFQNLNQGTNIRSANADFLETSNLVNSAFARYNNFELTLPNAPNFQYNPDQGNASVAGQALIYPGFKPMIGDFFLTGVGDGKLGAWRISAIAPTSWRNQHFTQVGYIWMKYADRTILQYLQAATKQTYVFDKQTYLTTSTCLLEENYYRDLRDLRSFRDILAKHYHNLFFDYSLNTFVRPDKIYDPYVVEFMASACSIYVIPRRPQQLYKNVSQTYMRTIWNRLLESTNTQINDLYPFYGTRVGSGEANDIFATPLVGKSFLKVLSKEEGNKLNNNPPLDTPQRLPVGYYVLSSAFYNNDLQNMTPFENLLWTTINLRQLSQTEYLLNNFIRQYLNLSNEDAFYHIPLYIALIDIAIPSIARKPPSYNF